MMGDPAPGRIRLVVDTDGGVDDAAALWWLLTRSDLDVAGIVATGSNRSVELVLSAIATILLAVGRPDVPVAGGLRAPRAASRNLASGNRFHGEDGLGGTAAKDARPDCLLSLEELWAGLSIAADRPTHILTLGPMTSLAWAWRHRPALLGTMQHVAMAGAFRVAGNASAAAESNVIRDPVSAADTLAAPREQPLRFVSLDVTRHALLTADTFATIQAGASPSSRFLGGPLRHYRSAHCGLYGGSAMPCHDLLAAFSVLHPDILEQDLLPVGIDTGESICAGRTVVDDRSFSSGPPAPNPPFVMSYVPRHLDAGSFDRLVAELFR